MSLEEKLDIAVIETSTERLGERLYVAFCMYNLNLVNKLLVSGKETGVAEKFFENWGVPLEEVIWERDSQGFKESVKNTLRLLYEMRKRVGKVYYIVNYEQLREAETLCKRVAKELKYKPEVEFQSPETSVSYTSLLGRERERAHA